MAIPAVTNTFVNGTSSDAGQVNTNFTDIINSLTDGTKSLVVDALTAQGAATFNGNVTLGDGTPDDITFNGSMASTLNVKTNNSFNIGGLLFGLAGVYLGSASSKTTRLVGSATTSYSLTFPPAVPASKRILKMDTSGNLTVEDYDVDNSTIESGSISLRIKDLGVGTAQIAAGAVTPEKRAALGHQISSSCGSLYTVQTSYAAVTNLSVTITTTGRPVYLGIIDDGSGNESGMYVNASRSARLRFMRDSTALGNSRWGNGANTSSTVWALDYWHIDVPAAGTYTYTLQAICTGSAGDAGIWYKKLIAYEL